MRSSLSIPLLTALSALSPCVAHALPNLESPNYQYVYAAPPDAAFDQRHREGATVPGWEAHSSLDYYLFEPRHLDGRQVDEAKVMVFLHGGSLNPVVREMKQQIEHYVRSGYTVVWPLFCNRGNLCLDFDRYEDNLVSATFSALEELAQPGHVAPTHDDEGRPKFVFAAHSLGTIVGARTTAKLGAMRALDDTIPLPSALLFHDPAGYEVAVGDIVMKEIFPLTPETLAGMPDDILMVAVTERLTLDEPNGPGTVLPLFESAPVLDKRAFVLPHQCVKSSWGTLSYTCPTITARSDERHGLFQHVYVSHHRTGERDAHLTPISRVAIFDRLLACATEALTDEVQPLCSGEQSLYTGAWTENGVISRPADPLYPYPMGP
jgi:hypothetical protein